MVEVGGRGGASGGRGRLRLRDLKGFVSHIQHALLPLDEVRRIEKATASAADLWDPRNGCLDAGLCARLVADYGPCKLVGAFGLDWLKQGTQLSHLVLLCRRDHQFREICWILGPESWRAVAACGGLWHPSRSPIEEDKMIR